MVRTGIRARRGCTWLDFSRTQPPPLSQFGILPFIYFPSFNPNLTQLPLTPGPQTPNTRLPNQKMGQIGTNVGTHTAPSASYLEKVLTDRCFKNGENRLEGLHMRKGILTPRMTAGLVAPTGPGEQAVLKRWLYRLWTAGLRLRFQEYPNLGLRLIPSKRCFGKTQSHTRSKVRAPKCSARSIPKYLLNAL